MDLSKYPLEKLLYVVAGVIPGFVALLIYYVAEPNSFSWFFSLGFLGYRTKLALVVLTAFVIGNSMTRFLSGIFGAFGGAIGGAVGGQPPYALELAPWRDPTWRAALSKVLGRHAPNDTQLFTKWFYDSKLQEIEFLPEANRPLEITKLEIAKLENQRQDGEWARWYRYYHNLILQPPDRDFLFHVQKGLNFNLQTAAVYVLVSSAIVPGIRRWWCILPALLWTLLLLAEEYWSLRSWADSWSTLDKQITYLTELGRSAGTPPSEMQKRLM
jgi:hypothetical protein